MTHMSPRQERVVVGPLPEAPCCHEWLGIKDANGLLTGDRLCKKCMMVNPLGSNVLDKKLAKKITARKP